MRSIPWIIVMLASASAATADVAIRPGVYSNVCYLPEADDYGGYEIHLRMDRSTPTLVFKICEGGCYEKRVSDLAVTRDQLTFKAASDWKNLDGGPTETVVDDYLFRRVGNSLVLDAPKNEAQYEPRKLRRVRGVRPERVGENPIGEGMNGWPAPIRRCDR